MSKSKKKNKEITPRWLTFENAAIYCGLSKRTIENYGTSGLLKVANIILPGATRGRKLIDRHELDALIENAIGVKTTADIHGKMKSPK